MKFAHQMLETTEHPIFEDDEVKKAIVQPVLVRSIFFKETFFVKTLICFH